jgi:hypothetical protein
MSHSIGAVKFNDGTIYFFEYNGTVDVCLPKLYRTREEVYDNWRNQKWEHHDNICNKSENAIMASTYGGGFGWNIVACKEHMLITDCHSHEALTDEENESYYNGLPDWYPKSDGQS